MAKPAFNDHYYDATAGFGSADGIMVLILY